MTTLKALVDTSTWDEVLDTLTLRTREPRHRGYLHNVWKRLRCLEPEPSRMRLLVQYAEDESGDYIHFSGLDGTTDEYGEISWDLVHTPWTKWLGMELVDSCLPKFRPVDIVGAAIYEMSWYGQTPSQVRKQRHSGRGSKSARVFLSYSHDDKDAFVSPLASELEALGLRVWFDEYDLMPGDSLRSEISSAIVGSKCAVVVLSKSYFRKAWTERELAGVTSMQISKNILVIPVLHGVSISQVASYDPSLADRLALSTSVLEPAQIALRIHEAVLTRTRKRRSAA